MNYFIKFGNTSSSVEIAFNFPVRNLEADINAMNVQIYTYLGKIYNLKVLTRKILNESAFFLEFNLTHTIFSNDTLNIFFNDKIFNSRQVVTYPSIQLNTSKSIVIPYTFICLEKCRMDPIKYKPILVPIIFICAFLMCLTTKIYTGMPFSITII